jgi:uncharacterized protein (TIGR02246 family)
LTTRASKKDQAAVLDVVQGVYDAWDNGNVDAFVADYLEDATAVLPGVHLKSRDEIRAAMQFSFDGPLKGTRTAMKLLDIRLATSAAAIVVTETGVLLPGETAAPPERTVIATWVLVNSEGRWQLAAYSNTPSAAAKPA